MITINSLGFWRFFATWIGYAIAVFGASWSLINGKLDALGACLTFGGLAVNGIGNLLGIAQSKREQAYKENLESRLERMDGNIKKAYDRPAILG